MPMSIYKWYFSQMDLLTELSHLPGICHKELCSGKMPTSVKLSKISSRFLLVFSHKMFSQQGLCLAARDLDLHTHLSSWICGKTASPSKKDYYYYSFLSKLSNSSRNS